MPPRWRFKKSATTARGCSSWRLRRTASRFSSRPPRRASGWSRCFTSATKCWGWTKPKPQMAQMTQTTQTTIAKIGEHVGQNVTIKGWLNNRRSSGKIHFLSVRDGTGFLQVVMGKKDVDEATFAKADHLGQESAIVVTGTVQEHPRNPGNYELIATALEVVNEAHDYPITPKEH